MVRIFLLWMMFCCVWTVQANSRGAAASLRITVEGEQIDLYDKSYALLIGVSDYTHGWNDLTQVPVELDGVETALVNQGFTVIRVNNPNDKQLQAAFEDFIDEYGLEPQNRLLFYYSGHGHSFKGDSKGYLVPTDAPDPHQDKKGFKRKALPMSKILSWARNIESKHALFLFDSCFSGTVFQARGTIPPPKLIERLNAKPVRQFITAGSAGETVPAESTFTPLFITALNHKKGDLNGDGYITGSELGLYLQQEVPHFVSQVPQYGKIRDIKLSEGDFIFQVSEPVKPLHLTVKTSPKNAQIQILNIVPVYQAGMLLKVDTDYKIAVTHPDYQRLIKTVQFKQGGEQVVSMVLTPKPLKSPVIPVMVKKPEAIKKEPAVIELIPEVVKKDPVVIAKPKGEVFTGSAAHFSDNGDGTVTDSNTGLQWMRCALGQTWHNKTCVGEAEEYWWDSGFFSTDVDKVTDDFSYAGYSNWRVPTIKELNSLVYCSNGKVIKFKNGFQSVKHEGSRYCDSDSRGDYQSPTIEQQVFPNTIADRFWSSSPDANSSGYAWAVNFNSGNVFSNYRAAFNDVRLVR